MNCLVNWKCKCFHEVLPRMIMTKTLGEFQGDELSFSDIR